MIDDKGKLSHLTSEVKKPTANDPTLKIWQSENSMVIAWLINSMELTIRKPYLFLPTAKEAWDVVWDTYSDLENIPQIFELKMKPWQFKQGDPEVMIYYNEMLTLWQELDLCYDDEWDCPSDSVRYMKWMEYDRVYVLLAGLNQRLGQGERLNSE